MTQEAGFDVSKADWLKHQADSKLSDEELEDLAGGGTGKNINNHNCAPYITANQTTIKCGGAAPT